MPGVLWGVACLSLPGPTTAGDVVREFREALSLQYATGQGQESCANGLDRFPRVDLYRLVPIADQAGCRLTDDDFVVAHIPDSNFTCAELEDIYRQRDEAELRYDRARESLEHLMESLDGETCQSPRRRHEASSAAQGIGGAQTANLLRQENKVLRYKLDQSEVVRQELQETAEMLRREFMLLIHEVMPRGPVESASPVAVAGTALAPSSSRPLQATPAVATSALQGPDSSRGYPSACRNQRIERNARVYGGVR